MRYQYIAAVLLILTASTPSLAMEELIKQPPPGNVLTNMWNGAANRIRGALNFKWGSTSEAPKPNPALFTGSPIGQNPIQSDNVIHTQPSMTLNDNFDSLPSGINKGMRKTGYSSDCGAEGYKIRGNLVAAWQLISAIRSREALVLEQQNNEEEIQVIADFDSEINQLEGLIRVMKKDLTTYWLVDPRRPIYAARIFLVEKQWREIKSKYQPQPGNPLGENSKGIARGNSMIRNQWKGFRTFAKTQIGRLQLTKLKAIIEELIRKAKEAKEYVIEMTNEWRNKARECMRFRRSTGNDLFTK